MGLLNVESGSDIPHDFNVIIEIPMHGAVKYEVDKDSGALFVDRFLMTSMFYPTNYGYIPKTLSEDGDPVDVLVIAPLAIESGAVVRCRPIGMLNMTDEKGVDAKILAVPHIKVCKLYQHINTYKDLPKDLLLTIEHFFTRYKDLEDGKWVKIDGWSGQEEALKEISESVARFNK